MTGMRGGLTAIPASASRSRSAAGAISEEWNGALTGSAIARFAPRAFADSTALCTAPAWPAMTTCPGALKFTASQTSPRAASAHAAPTASS